MRTLNSNSGAYAPAFFYIELDSEKPFDDLDGPSKLSLVHEYVHFMQDIGTVYGLSNIQHVISYILKCIRMLLDKKVAIGQNGIIAEGEDEHALNEALMKQYFGVDLYDDLNGMDAIGVRWITHTVMRKYDVPVPHVVYEDDHTGRKIEVHTGALHVMECMAYLVEQKYGLEEVLPRNPYLVARDYVGRVYSECDINNKTNIISLCDVSLDSYHPAWFMRQILEHAATNSEMCEDPRRIYEIANAFEFKINGRIMNRVEHKNQRIEDVISEASKLFPGDALSGPKNWFSSLLRNANNYEMRNQYIWPHLLSNMEEEGVVKLRDMIEYIGLPFVKNKRNEYGYYHEDEEYWAHNQYFVALKSIYDYFSQGKCNCQLYHYCAISNITDQRCTDSPWMRCEDDALCPYAQLWKTWGLMEVI